MTARRKPDIDTIFAALADPARRRAIELLGQAPRSAGDLADALGLPAPAMSRHLKVLRECGLVADSHPAFDARVRIYALNTASLGDLKDWLAKAERAWAIQLGSFARHIARRTRT